MFKLINSLKMQIKAHHVIITLFIIIPIYSILVLTFTRYKQVEAELVYDLDRTVVFDDASSYMKDFDMDSLGNVYVFNDDYLTIDKFDSDGFKVDYSVALPNSNGLAVTDSGEVFVSVIGQEYESILHFDSNLDLIATYDIAPTLANIGLRGLTVYNGFVYVAAEYTNAIFSVDLSNGTVSIHNQSGLISNPVDVEIDVSGAEEILYVLNMEGSFGNPQIYYCNLYSCAVENEGSFAQEIEYPWKIAVDSYGFVYVLDLYLPGLRIYDDAHSYIEDLLVSETVTDVSFETDRIYLLATGTENRAGAFYPFLDAPEVSPTPTPLQLDIIEFDDFEGYTLPSLDIIVSGDTTTASIQPDINEPTYIDGEEVDYTAWFNYYAQDDVNVTINTCSTEYDNGLAIYWGDPGEPYDLSLLNLQDGMASMECPNLYYGAEFEVTLNAEEYYYFQFGGQYGANGNFEIQFSTSSAPPTTLTPTPSLDNDDFVNAIEIGLDETYFSQGILENSTLEVNEPDSVIYDKYTISNSVWWKFTAPYDTDISINTCNIQYGDMDTYLTVYNGTQLSDLTKVIDNQLGCSAGDGSKVFLSVTEGTTYYIQVALRNPGDFIDRYPLYYNLELLEEVDYSAPPVNDDFNDAVTVELDQLNSYGEYVPNTIPSTRNATMEVGEPDASKYQLDPRSIWWKWTNDGTAREVWVDTCNATNYGRIDSLLSVYTGSSVSDLTLIAENDEFIDDTSDAEWWCGWQEATSFLTFQAQPDTTYYIRLLDISNRDFPVNMTIRNRPTFYAVSDDTPPGDYWCSNHGGVARTIPYGMSDYGGSWEAWEECWAWCEANMTDEFPICQDNGDSKRSCWLNRTPEGGMDNCEWVEPNEGWNHPMGSYVGEVGGYLLSLDPDLRATLVSNLEMDVTVFRQVGERGIYVLDADDSAIMANVGVLFNANHDWTDLNGEADLIEGKVFIDDPSSEPGALGSYNLMAPIFESDPSDYLLLCPLSNNILDVSETCPGATIVSEADPTVSVVTGTDGNDYWMIEGLTQSMGAMNYTIPYTPSCGNGIIDEDEQCDGDNLGNYSCSDFPGYNSGDLSCSESCTFDIAQCSYIEPSTTPVPIPTVGPSTTITPSVTGIVSSSTPIPTPTPQSDCIYISEQGDCIEELEIINVRTSTDDGSIEICWDSNAPSSGVIKYGARGIMDKITLPETEEKLLDHCISINDLEYDIPYDFEIDIEYGEYLDSYIGNFELKYIDYDSKCNIYLNRDYNYDDKGNVSFSFTTDNTSYCTLNYGNDPQQMDAVGTIIPYTSYFKGVMDIGLDNRLNVYYQVNCVSVVNQCSASDVISAKVLAPLLDEMGLLSPQNKNLIATSSIGLALVGLMISFVPVLFTSPNLLMYGVIWFLPRKKQKPWGIVYDTTDNRPVAFAVVRVYGQDGRLVKQSVSDLEGKYSFILDQGNYRLEAVHSDYDQFSKEVNVVNKEDQLALDIRLNKNGKPASFNFKKVAYSMLSGAGWVIGILGLMLSIIALIFYQSVFNILVLALYLIQLGILLFVRPKKNWGYIFDQQTGARLKGGFLRILDKQEGRQIELQMSDAKGRFGFVLPKGDYYLGISMPGYELVDSSSLITLSDGSKVLDIGEGKITDVTIAMTRKSESVIAQEAINPI